LKPGQKSSKVISCRAKAMQMSSNAKQEASKSHPESSKLNEWHQEVIQKGISSHQSHQTASDVSRKLIREALDISRSH
jgi:hypothetical protein